jgi:hypothetical protein
MHKLSKEEQGHRLDEKCDNKAKSEDVVEDWQTYECVHIVGM